MSSLGERFVTRPQKKVFHLENNDQSEEESQDTFEMIDIQDAEVAWGMTQPEKDNQALIGRVAGLIHKKMDHPANVEILEMETHENSIIVDIEEIESRQEAADTQTIEIDIQTAKKELPSTVDNPHSPLGSRPAINGSNLPTGQKRKLASPLKSPSNSNNIEEPRTSDLKIQKSELETRHSKSGSNISKKKVRRFSSSNKKWGLQKRRRTSVKNSEKNKKSVVIEKFDSKKSRKSGSERGYYSKYIKAKE